MERAFARIGLLSVSVACGGRGRALGKGRWSSSGVQLSERQTGRRQRGASGQERVSRVLLKKARRASRCSAETTRAIETWERFARALIVASVPSSRPRKRLVLGRARGGLLLELLTPA